MSDRVWLKKPEPCQHIANGVSTFAAVASFGLTTVRFRCSLCGMPRLAHVGPVGTIYEDGKEE